MYKSNYKNCDKTTARYHGKLWQIKTKATEDLEQKTLRLRPYTTEKFGLDSL